MKPERQSGIRVRGGIYLSVEQYRRLIGYRSVQNIYRALKDGRIPGSIQVGNTWIIPRNAVMIDNSVKHGGWAELRRRKEEWDRTHGKDVDL